jgi:uncharacterized protein involved in exopolysaccharide biosynthesis
VTVNQSSGFPRQLREDEVSLMVLGTALLRRRRTIGTLVFAGALIGAAVGFISRPRYVADATFIPQDVEGTTSELAAAATQFGIRLSPSLSETGWGAPVYVELLRSRALLEPIARDTVAVQERGGERAAVADLLDIRDDDSSRRVEKTVRHLARDVVKPSEVKSLRGVRLSVATEWPSVSLEIAQRLVNGVNRFNLETRQTQAAAERRFVGQQAEDAENALRVSEERLKAFLQRNRTILPGSEVAFERDRLQREVTLRQDLHTAWLKSREEARIREVRNTPVITIIEPPKFPAQAESRGIAVKAIVGAFGGGLLGVSLAFLSLLLLRARSTPGDETREFFHLVEEVRPRFLKKHTAR